MAPAPLDLGDATVQKIARCTPLPPYVFLFRQANAFTALVPDEIAQIVRDAGREALTTERARFAEVVRYVDTATTYYGIIALDEAYRQYSGLAGDPLEPAAFTEAAYRSSTGDDPRFGMTECDREVYLVDYTPSDEFAGHDAIDGLDAYRD